MLSVPTLGHAGLCPGVDGLAWSLEAPWGERGPGRRRRRPAAFCVEGSRRLHPKAEKLCSGTEPSFLSLGK